MSSPFAYFRKRQKAMIVIIGVICMVAFVFLGVPLDDLRGPSGANLTVATTKYGTIHETDMLHMVQSRAVVNDFLRNLYVLTVEALQREGMDPNLVQFRAFEFQNQVAGLMAEPSEVAVMDSMILARKAEEMGIVVSDAYINQFIGVLTQNKVTSDQIRTMLRQMDVSQGRIFEALRTELLAREVRVLAFEPLIRTAPPGLRWDYYRRLNERVNAEVVPIRVADFVGKVPDPSVTELQAFFERFKDREPTPDSPDPGFHQPERGKFQYFRADFETFLAQANAAVTAEEVQAYYDANREQFPYTQLPDEPTPDEPTTDEMPAVDDNAPSDSDAPAEPSQDEPAPDESNPPAEDAPAAEEPSAEQPSDEAPATPAEEPAPPADTTPDSPEQSAPGDDQSAIRLQADFGQFELALAQDEEPADEPTGPALSPSDDPAAETTPEPAEESPTPEVSANEAPADDSQPEMTVEEELDVEDLVVPQSITDSPEPRYEPLEKVEGQIRRLLASQRANQLIDDAFAALTEKMNAFYDEHYDAINAWRTARDEESTQQPDLPQFDARAAAQGIEGISADETALLSAREIQELTDLGRSNSGNTPFVQTAFSSLRLFTPKQSQDLAGNRFLYWKTDESKEFVPTFDQVRDQVVEAWKLRAARDLARQKADELASKASSSDKPLREVFGGTAGIEVIDTGTFTWMTYGTALPFSSRQPPRLSEVRGVPEVGHDFMRAVFSLDPGEIGLAFNAPESIIYVIRLASVEPSEVVLREMFMADRFQSYANAAMGDVLRVRETWERNIRDEAGLDWARMPRETLR